MKVSGSVDPAKDRDLLAGDADTLGKQRRQFAGRLHQIAPALRSDCGDRLAGRRTRAQRVLVGVDQHGILGMTRRMIGQRGVGEHGLGHDAQAPVPPTLRWRLAGTICGRETKKVDGPLASSWRKLILTLSAETGWHPTLTPQWLRKSVTKSGFLEGDGLQCLRESSTCQIAA